jgi:RHS repeat-associated protein
MHREQGSRHMSEAIREKPSILAASLFSLVIATLLYPVGVIVRNGQALSPAGGFSYPADPLSDSVGATVGEFRVGESGAASYSIPLFTAPGVSGVVPKLSLNYSSQGGAGPLGRGWTVGGVSAISRCRATREAGDSIVGGVPGDGNPLPVNFGPTDKYCLDGQRLIPAQGTTTCNLIAGMSVEAFFTEIQTYQRVCAYTPTGGAAGVAFFTVERKDGSISWYGDRDNNSVANRPDGYVNSTAPGKQDFALTWAQTRFQDSTGNYIDYAYHENPNGVVGEHLLASVSYTGRNALPGQTTPSQAPFASISFLYQTKPVQEQAKGYFAGGLATQAHRLYAVKSTSDGVDLRYYRLDYSVSGSGSGQDLLNSVQECRDSTLSVCFSPTTFAWSTGRYEFSTKEYPTNLTTGSAAKFRGMKYGDVDGDGRLDIVYLKEGESGDTCVTEHVLVLFSYINASGTPAYYQGAGTCTPTGLATETFHNPNSWQLLDYNGDGLDDFLVRGPDGTSWRVYPSLGRSGTNFDATQNLLSGLSGGGIPAQSQIQMVDFNGDGLNDILYSIGAAYYVRLMERNSTGFGWGNARAVQLNGLPATAACGTGQTCALAMKDLRPIGNTALYDFNADSGSDLLFITYYGTGWWNCDPLQQPGCLTASNAERLNAVTVESITSTTVTLRAYHSWAGRGFQAQRVELADFNGDGYTDAMLEDFGVYLNNGNGFDSAIDLGGLAANDHLQIVDANGDGRADLLYPISTATGAPFVARLATPNGGFASQSSLLGGQAYACEGNGCDINVKSSMFADIDADGNLDFLSIKLSNDNMDVYASRAAERYSPRDTITMITNGYGAQTELAYSPLTLKDLYRPDNGTRNASNWGRGSPVFDLLAPMYVVRTASSSAPQGIDANARSSLHYRYTGAKTQTGGRGFLGFREVVSIDPNQTGGYIATTTEYAQNFPFVGLPVKTVKRVAANMIYLPSPCLGSAPTDTCFAPRSAPGSTPGGTLFSQSVQVWTGVFDQLTAFVPFAPSSQATVLPLTIGTEDIVVDPFTATQTSRVVTSLNYGWYANAAQTSVDTYAGTATTPASTVITQNTYGDDASRWRLGRLTGSTVTYRRPGFPDVVRSTSFAYAMSGPVTGLLTEERTQPNGNVREDLRKAYVLDDYGNRVANFLCSQQVVDCRSTNIQYNLWQWDRIHRYSRQEFDARGRYPTRTIELFRPAAAATVDTTQPIEVVTAEVLARDEYGNVIEAIGLNAVRSIARFGALGRVYYTWKQTDPYSSVPNAQGVAGATAVTTFRWCGTGSGEVNCPAGARFRGKTVATASPTQWIYYDVLGREVLKAAQTFNIGDLGKDASGVCTQYDAAGRATRISTPFFLPGSTTSGEPEGISGVCSSLARTWTQSEFDVIGRPVKVTEANSAVSTVAYSNLVTTTTNARGYTKVEVKNALGELVQANDNAGLTTNHLYNAAGDLQQVSRDAGRGAIVTWIGYDSLGRKTYVNDPDSGEKHFGYNAAGEMEIEHDGAGTGTLMRYDFRGRVTWRGSLRQTPGGQIWDHSSMINFDTAPNGLGQEHCSWTDPNIAYEAWQGQSDKKQVWSRCNSFDSMGRVIASATYVDGISYASALQLDGLGRAWKAQDPSGKWLKTEFGPRGHVVRLCESDAADTWHSCPSQGATTYLMNHETDQFGNVIRDIRGGSQNMQVFKQYDQQTGRLNQICVGTASTNCTIMRDTYAWDAVGNLSWRDRLNYTEEFAYDSIDRLVYARVLRAGSTQYQPSANYFSDWFHYDKLGNVCGKPIGGTQAVGLYYAGRAGCGQAGQLGGLSNSSQTQSPHQVLSAGIYQYSYDSHGNQVFADAAGDSQDRTIRYNGRDQAYEVFKGLPAAPVRAARFWYDPAGNRYKREDTGSGIVGTRRTIYVGNIEIVTENGSTTYKRYIGGLLVQNVVAGVASNRYLFADHLGSLVAMTDEAGVVLEGGGFNAFGERRANGSATTIVSSGSAITTRGFTGHEMLDGLDVIHMNGRIFDPTLGRFLQPDPVVQDPGNPQNWNAYTYVFNNPYRYTDPSGMIGLEERQWLATIIVIVSIIFAPQLTAAFGKMGAAVLVGFTAGYAATGTIQGGVYGAFSAALFYGIGSYFQSAQWATSGSHVFGTGLNAAGFAIKVLAHGVAGGVLSYAQGGKFGHGFLSAGAAQLFSPMIDLIGGGAPSYAALRVIAAAIVGGTVSQLTGGKFASGAMTAAFSQAFNGEAHRKVRTTFHRGRNLLGNAAPSDSEHVWLEAERLAGDIESGFTERKPYNEDGDGDTHCAEIIKHRDTFGAAKTTLWRQGRQIVWNMDILPGTAIATFDSSGRYPQSETSYRHAAIFIKFDEYGRGIWVLDQWDGLKAVNYRLMPWNSRAGNAHQNYVGSASNFSTIKW